MKNIPANLLFFAFCLVASLSCEEKKTVFCFPTSIVESYDGDTNTTDLEYDAANHVTSMSASGSETTYSYDGSGRVITSSSSSGETTYHYDPIGRLMATVTVDGMNSVTDTFDYNDSGQLATIAYGSGTTATLTYPNNRTRNYSTYTYAPPGCPTCAFAITFEYDTKPNPKKVIMNTLIDKLITDNNITKQTDGSDETIFVYTYNDRGYPTSSVVSGANTGTVAITYNCK